MTALNVNGRPVEVDVESRRLLVDVVRDELGPTGTTVGCGHGVCGSCTVSIDGVAQRSCLVFAVQCEGSRSEPSKDLPHRTARCTPGFLMLLAGALDANPDLDQDEEALTAVLASNLCRCTGYVSIRAAAQQARPRCGDPVRCSRSRFLLTLRRTHGYVGIAYVSGYVRDGDGALDDL